MARLALIRDGFCVNICVGDPGSEPPGYVVWQMPEGAEGSPGWTWDGVKLVRPPAMTAARFIPVEDFIDRFTEPEWEALTNHANTKAKAFVARLGVSASVNLDHLRIAAALDAMTTAGIIAAGRKNEILG